MLSRKFILCDMTCHLHRSGTLSLSYRCTNVNHVYVGPSHRCTGPVGIYLLIKKCVILLLHVRNGCFHPAPFLDEHGEADLGLRRGRPQFLNPLRYDDLRRLWLTHGIPIHVARKIEQSYDFGGWRTL